MGKYNFEKDKKDFDKTVRLDDLNEEIQKLEEDAGEMNQEKPKASYENSEGKKNRTALLCGIIAVLLVCVIAMGVKLFMSGKNLTTGSDIENAQNVFDSSSTDENYIIQAFKNNIVYLYGMDSKKIYSAETDNNTVITGSNGGKMQFGDLDIGDIVHLVKNEQTGTAQQIRWADDAWKKENKGDVRIDTESSSVSCENEIYKYDSTTMFIYDGKTISPGDVSHADIVNITGIKNNVISVTVVKTHGYVYFKNYDDVTEIKARVDFGEEYDVSSGSLIVPEGTHTIIVSGSNIEDYMEEVTVTAEESAEIDLSKATSKISTLTIDVTPNVGFEVKIDDKVYNDGTRVFELEKKKYTIEVSKEGYVTYKKEVVIGDEDVELKIMLQEITTDLPQDNTSQAGNSVQHGNVTIYSEPKWAKVYIDGEYKGITPVMESLSYGEHYIKLELDGYEDIGEHITVNNPEYAYHGILN